MSNHAIYANIFGYEVIIPENLTAIVTRDEKTEKGDTAESITEKEIYLYKYQLAVSTCDTLCVYFRELLQAVNTQINIFFKDRTGNQLYQLALRSRIGGIDCHFYAVETKENQILATKSIRNCDLFGKRIAFLARSRKLAFLEIVRIAYRMLSHDDASMCYDQVSNFVQYSLGQKIEETQFTPIIEASKWDGWMFKRMIVEEFYVECYEANLKEDKVKLQNIAYSLYVSIATGYTDILIESIIAKNYKSKILFERLEEAIKDINPNELPDNDTKERIDKIYQTQEDNICDT